MKLSEMQVDQTVYLNVDGEWLGGNVKSLIDDKQGELVEVGFPGRFPEICWAEDLRPVPSDEPMATQRQAAYLVDLGYTGGPLTKSQASAEIDHLKAWKNAAGPCHYCGQPANGFGFFDELACAGCGGR